MSTSTLLVFAWSAQPRSLADYSWIIVWRRREYYTGRFIMFSVIINIYNKKTKGPTLRELFTATGKPKKGFFFFWQLQMFDVCTTGDTAHIDTIFKFLPHTRQQGYIDILHCCNDPCLRSTRSRGIGGRNTRSLTSFYLYRFCKYVSYGFPIIHFL